ncbi:helix-turn-helix domain-containing protein [Caulobacter sp. LARHSG274]
MPSSIFDSVHRRLVELLVEARKRDRLTQKMVGERVGKSQSFVSMIERHQRRVDVVEFIALCRALGKDPEVFFALLVAEQS